MFNANYQSCYPELESNPWTFVAGPYEKKQVVSLPPLSPVLLRDVASSDLRNMPVPVTRSVEECPTVYIIDSPRWNYEVRAYLDIDKNRDPRSLLWLNFMLSDRWAEIHTLLLNDSKNKYKGIVPTLNGPWGLRSPVFGDGTQLDAAMYSSNIKNTRWRKVEEDARPVELSFLKLKEGKLEDG
jgi:hypothetical protein